MDFLLSLLFFPYRQRILAIKADKETTKAAQDMEASYKSVLMRRVMKTRQARFLLVLMPLFGLIYLLTVVKLFDRDINLLANMVCGIFIKMGYVCTISWEASVLPLTAETNVVRSRQQFLKCLFHEIRVPL